MIEYVIDIIKTQVLENDFAAGGLLLGAMGSIVALLRKWPIKIWEFIKRRTVVVADVLDDTEAFQWFIYWLSKQRISKKTRLLTVNATNDGEDEYDETPRTGGSDRNKKRIVLSAGPGNHFMFYKGKFLWIDRQRKEPEGNMSKKFEKVTIRTFGFRSRQVIRQVFEEACELYHKEHEGKISIYVGTYSNWHEETKREPRPLSSVILKEGLMEDILGDMDWFIQNETWYRERGVPYRRGYAFVGPPGTGKSSLAIALAGHLDMDLYVINELRSKGDNDLCRLLTRVPNKNIILIEDIDATGANVRERKPEAVETKEGVSSSEPNNEQPTYGTLSGMLNAIDGVMSQEGSILVVTTNHPDKLDKALMRPGRIDRLYIIDNCTEEQVYRMYVKFTGNDEGFQSFREGLKEHPSPADVQGKLMELRGVR